MVNTVLNTYVDILREQVLGAISDATNGVEVRYVKPYDRGKELHMNAINVALFRSVAEKDLLGNYQFGTPTKDNLAIHQKPPLRVSLDALLIFNFRHYESALDCYGQVLGYFYNNDVFTVRSDGYENQVQVLLSSFNDLNEIEIWNSFNTPGIMILRYELKYAMITGRYDELPVLRYYSSSFNQPEKNTIDPLVLSMVYTPIAGSFSTTVLAETNAFCSIDIKADNADFLITERYNALIESYREAHKSVEEVRRGLEKLMEDPANYIYFNPYFPSIDGILQLDVLYRQNLEAMAPASKSNYLAICERAKQQIDPPQGLIAVFLARLQMTTDYLEITRRIDASILEFNVVGESTYERKSKNEFIERPELSTLQLRLKWWEIENRLQLLHNRYQEEIDSRLLEPESPAYVNFKELLEACLGQIDGPLERFQKLNLEYNQGDIDSITIEVRRKYSAAYSSAHAAVNLIENQDLPAALARSLQEIFIEQNTIT